MMASNECHDLISLDIGGCRNLSLDKISFLLDSCPNIRALNICGINELRNFGGHAQLGEAAYYIWVIEQLKEKYMLETLEFTTLWYPLIRQNILLQDPI